MHRLTDSALWYMRNIYKDELNEYSKIITAESKSDFGFVCFSELCILVFNILKY